MQGNQQVRRDGDHIAAAEFVTITADNTNYQMKATQHVMHFITALEDDAAIVWLPPVAEAAGMFYYICATTGASGGDISLMVRETAAELTTNGDMDADDDHILLFSDGVNWRTILDGVV
jgi:hypothetical protein